MASIKLKLFLESDWHCHIPIYSSIPISQYSNIPVFKYSSSAIFQYCNIPIFLYMQYSNIPEKIPFFPPSLGTKLAHKLGLTPPRPTEREVFPIDLKILPLFWTNYQLWYLKVRRCEPFTSQIIGELSKRIQFKSLGNNPKESSMIKCQNQGGAGGSPGAQPSSGWRADQVSISIKKVISFFAWNWTRLTNKATSFSVHIIQP